MSRNRNKYQSRQQAETTVESDEHAIQGRRVEDYELLWGAAEQMMTTWVPAWKDVRDYLLPHRGLFAGEVINDGSNRHGQIVDSTACAAHRVMIGGLKGGLTSSARPWFRLGIGGDRDLNRYAPVRRWLDEVEKRMFALLKSSNFYSAIDPVYEEESGFGTGCWWIEQDDEKGVVFVPQTCGTYMISSSRVDGSVDTIFRRVPMTLAAIALKFGKDRLSAALRQMLDKAPYEYHDVRHCVRPNTHRKWGEAGVEGKAFESLYWIAGESDFLRVSGYEEFPAPTPRWDATVGVYGLGPGRAALGAIKMLQEIEISTLEAIQKGVDPPVLTPSGSFKTRLNRDPGGETEIDQRFIEKVRSLYEGGLDVSAAMAKAQDVRLRIKEIFFNDLFLMLQGNTPKTAYEVAQLQNEKLRLLGPVVEQQFYQLLDPTINRVFHIMHRMALLPQWPEELDEEELTVEYISLMAQAQKLAAVDAINAHIGFVSQLATLQANAGQTPDALDKIDTDAAVDEYADATGAPAKIARSKEEVADIRSARAQAMQAQQEAQQQAQDVAMAKEMSETGMGENTALAQLRANTERI